MIKQILVLAFIVLLVSGCSSKTEENTTPSNLVCRSSSTYLSIPVEVEDVYENDGTKVIKQIGTYKLTTTGAYDDEDGTETLKNMYIDEFNQYNDIAIFSYEIIDTENGFNIVTTIDIENASIQDLIAIGVLTNEDSDMAYIGVNETKEANEGKGFTCIFAEK